MAQVKYPKLPLKEAEVICKQDRLFEHWIYPNLVSNLPYLKSPHKPQGGKPENTENILSGYREEDDESIGIVPHPSPNPLNIKIGELPESQAFEVLESPSRISPPVEYSRFKHFNFQENIDQEKREVEESEIVKEIMVQRKGVLIRGNTWSECRKPLDLIEEATLKFADKGTAQMAGENNDFEDSFEIMPYEDAYDICMRKFGRKITQCFKFTLSLFKYIGKCCFPYNEALEKLLMEGQIKDYRYDDLPLEAKDNPEIRKPSPDWPELCHFIASSFSQVLKDTKIAMLPEPIQKMEFNTENLIAIAAHITDVLTMSSIAFTKEVGWTDSDNIVSKSSRVVLAETTYWTLNYWVCFFLCVLFAGLSMPAIRLAKSGRYGVDKDMKPVKTCSWPGLLTRAVSLLAVSLYITIIKTQFDALSCIYDDDGKWRVIRNSELVCFSPEHMAYFTSSVVAMFIYYPLATLLYPNIQYQNKALDLKFDTTYLVIEAQGKLAIAGFAAFLPREKYLKMQLIVCICVNLLLGAIVTKTQPCLVRPYNLWKAAGYYVITWCGLWALINVVSGGEQLFCLVMLAAGVGLILATYLAVQIKLYGWSFHRDKVCPIESQMTPCSSPRGIQFQEVEDRFPILT